MRAVLGIASASVLLALASSGGAQQSESDSGLRPGAGRELVEVVCTTCHTAQNIVASRMSREAWDATIGWMQETQGLVELEPDLRATILDYLEATQGLDEAELDAGDSPWARPRYRPNPLWSPR